MDANLIIDDGYVSDVGRMANIRGIALEEVFDSYLTILTQMESSAVVGGEIASALTAYRESVQKMNDQITTLSADMKNVCDCFLTDFNTADEYLF